MKTRKYSLVDLFSGAGGLCEGFSQAGFKVIGNVENDPYACQTLRTRKVFRFLMELKRPDIYHKYCRDEEGYSLEDLMEAYPALKEKIENEVIETSIGKDTVKEVVKKLKKNLKNNGLKELDILSAGPPCQTYSYAGRGRLGISIHADKRNFLFRHIYEIVTKVKPKFFVIENVPGIMTAINSKVYKEIKALFSSGYYMPDCEEDGNILDARNHGVPQIRRRVFIVGIRKNLKKYGLNYPTIRRQLEEISVREAISDIPRIEPGTGKDNFYSEYTRFSNLSVYQLRVRRNSPGLMNHFARPQMDSDRKIYKKVILTRINEKRQLKVNELPKGWCTHKNTSAFTDRFKVHVWNEVGHTIVAHISKDGHYNIHPDVHQQRSLTVREAARLQAFPDNYKFEGPRTAQFRQVGNAVPPLLSKALAVGLVGELKRIEG